ncbi:TOBE domain protein [compost metagenome]
MGSYNVLTRAEAQALFRSVGGNADSSFAIRPEALLLLLAEGEEPGDVADGMNAVRATVQSVSVLGSIIRTAVEAKGISMTVDVLNDGRWLRVREGENVTLLLDAAQLLHLDQEGA